MPAGVGAPLDMRWPRQPVQRETAGEFTARARVRVSGLSSAQRMMHSPCRSLAASRRDVVERTEATTVAAAESVSLEAEAMRT